MKIAILGLASIFKVHENKKNNRNKKIKIKIEIEKSPF